MKDEKWNCSPSKEDIRFQIHLISIKQGKIQRLQLRKRHLKLLQLQILWQNHFLFLDLSKLPLMLLVMFLLHIWKIIIHKNGGNQFFNLYILHISISIHWFLKLQELHKHDIKYNLKNTRWTYNEDPNPSRNSIFLAKNSQIGNYERKSSWNCWKPTWKNEERFATNKCLEPKLREWRTEHIPNAKKKVKIAENTFPITMETAELMKSLTLKTKFLNENEETSDDDCIKWDGYA